MQELYSAPKDFLTGCFTKPDLLPLLNRMKTASDETHKPYSILLLDLDHFKSYNDKYGHLFGDEILKYFSSTLRLILSTVENYAFRFGGDEFVVVFPVKDSKEAFAIASQIEKTIKTRMCLTGGNLVRTSFSAGVASYPVDAKTADELLENADKAMYYSKKKGRGRVTQFSNVKILRLQWLLPVLSIAIAAILIVLALAHLNDVKRFLKAQVARAKSMIPAQQPQVKPAPAKIPPKMPSPAKKFDILYLKSGKTCRGIITRQTPTTVYLKMKTEFGGEMVVGFNKSEIDTIE